MQRQPKTMHTRRLLQIAQARFADDPVVLLEGPRTVGKSALLQEIAAINKVGVVDLDSPPTFDAVNADPAAFVAGPSPIMIDEYQKVPRLLDAIKSELNRDGSAGRFIITGSTRYEALPLIAQALTGRLHQLTVHPLTQGEINGVEEHFLEELFLDANRSVKGMAAVASTTTRSEYIEKITAGGFPIALNRKNLTSRSRWFDDYIKLTLGRDLKSISNVKKEDDLSKILAKLAGQTAQILNINRIASELEISQETARRHLKLLEAVFLVYEVDAWGTTLNARSSSHPKIHVTDSGVAARLMRLTAEKLEKKNGTDQTELGHLLETFVVGELIRQASWMDGIAGIGHWRTYDQQEVDLVIERDDGTLAAFEVKTAGAASQDDFKHLRTLRDKMGKAFRAGVVFYLGNRAYPIDDRLHVIPVDRLWVP